MATIAADGVFADSSTGEHYVARTPTLAADSSNDIVAVYLKAGTASHAWVRYAGSRYVYVNLIAGTATPSNGADLAYVVPLAGGWLRVVWIIPDTADVTNPEIAIGPSGVAGASSYPGSPLDSIYAYGAQLQSISWERSGEYVRTDGTSATGGGTSATQFSPPAGMTEAAGCIGATVAQYQKDGDTSGETAVDHSATIQVLLGSSNSLCATNNDGTTDITGCSAQSSYSSPVRLVIGWLGAARMIRHGPAIQSGIYDGDMGVTNVALYPWRLGAENPGGGLIAHGWLSDIAIGNDPNACN